MLSDWELTSFPLHTAILSAAPACCHLSGVLIHHFPHLLSPIMALSAALNITRFFFLSAHTDLALVHLIPLVLRV